MHTPWGGHTGKLGTKHQQHRHKYTHTHTCMHTPWGDYTSWLGIKHTHTHSHINTHTHKHTHSHTHTHTHTELTFDNWTSVIHWVLQSHQSQDSMDTHHCCLVTQSLKHAVKHTFIERIINGGLLSQVAQQFGHQLTCPESDSTILGVVMLWRWSEKVWTSYLWV